MTILEKLIALRFSNEAKSETTKVDSKFLDAKLVDGTIVHVEGEAFEVGMLLQVQDEMGGLINAPEGEHELEDGTVLVVDADSKITAVNTTTPESEETDSAPASTEAMSKTKIFSKSAKENFTIIKDINIWEIEADNTTFNLGEKITYTVDDVQYNVSDGQYELEDKTNIFVNAEGIVVMRILPDGTIETPTAASPEAAAEEMSEINSPEDVEVITEAPAKSEVELEVEKLKAEVAALKAKNEKLSKAPAAAPIETNRFEKLFSKNKDTKAKGNFDLVNRIADLRNNG